MLVGSQYLEVRHVTFPEVSVEQRVTWALADGALMMPTAAMLVTATRGAAERTVASARDLKDLMALVI